MPRSHDRTPGTDPSWPTPPPGDEEEVVAELVADRQGSLSPFGELVLPMPADELPYHHPHTIINR